MLKKKARSRRYPAETIMDTDYADNLALLVNTPTQAKSLLHRQELAARGIGFHVNANETEYLRFEREGATTTLNSSPLKLVDKFTYFGSSILSTESDVNMRPAKMRTAID